MSPLYWQKSSYSSEASNCVELATAPDGSIWLRESDDPDGVLTVGRPGLSAFLLAVKAGRFDRIAP
ncbi:DUF397 domain-containing protein [Streptomyces sp. H27-D2]|uniref:DUF397 domain-containing protein n=1 Tax=Streptomyces sp. H27-D2 TaxID=3046304 RepID=UPI002DBBB39B|nr:DUF397 domain-containing protein [Streptomyces sp. H27-D2]MEC4020537.1 DUF397 domain-containing protein [Streptomyces sp. H27-D2]